MAETAVQDEELIQPDVFKDVRESAEKTLPILVKVRDTLESFLGGAQEKIKNNPLGSAEDIRGLTSSWNGATSAIVQHEKILKNIAVVEAQVAAAHTEEAQALAAVRMERNELNKVQKQSAILAQAEEGSLDQLKVKLSQATKAFDAMGEARRKSIEGLKQVSAIETFRLKIDEIEQSTGRFQRNVGNYKDAYNGLAVSINQLTREAPAAAISMQTFFLAISNNIPMLSDQISRLRAENAELLKQGQPTVSIAGKIASAFFSWQTALSLVITLVTLYGAKLIDFIAGTDEAAKKQADFNDVLDKEDKILVGLQRSMQDYIDKIDVLSGKITGLRAKQNQVGREYLDKLKEINDKVEQENKRALEALNKDRKNPYTQTQIDELRRQRGEGRSIPFDVKQYLDTLGKIRDQSVIDLTEARNTFAKKQELVALEDKKEKEDAEAKKKKKKEDSKTMEEINKEDFQAEVAELDRQQELKRIALSEQYKAGQLSEQQYNDKLFEVNQFGLMRRAELERAYRQDSSDAYSKYYENEEKKFKDHQDKQQKILDDAQKANGDLNKIAAQSQLNKENAIREERIKRENLMYDQLKKASENYYNARVKAIDREIDASKRRQQEMEQLAAYGIDNAKQSIAAEEKIQAEAQAKRDKLEKQKQRSELLLLGSKDYVNRLENGQSSGQALVGTLTDLGLLVAAINALPLFFEGTERIADKFKPQLRTGRDDYIFRGDGRERIIKGTDNDLMGDLTNKELTKVAMMYNHGLLVPLQNQRYAQANPYSNAVIEELQSIRQQLKNIPQPKLEFDDLRKIVLETVETHNSLIKNHYEVPQWFN